MAVGDLVTLQQAKDWLEITGSEQDTKIGSLITVASAQIAKFLGRTLPLDAAVRSEIYDGHGGWSLAVRNWPIVSVSSLAVDAVAIPASVNMNWGHYNNGEMMLHLRGASYARGRANVSVTYTGGFPAGGPEMAILAQACLFTVQALNESQGLSQVLQSENVPGSYSYSIGAGGAGSLPPAVRTMISSFRAIL